MAELKNCKQCGRVFASVSASLCRKCLDQIDQDFVVVRKYVRDHNGADVLEVSQATGVSEEIILHFLREGRLISRGFVASLQCERCSTRIDSGRFCPKCLFELDQQLQGVMPVTEKAIPRTAVKEQMHINKFGK